MVGQVFKYELKTLEKCIVLLCLEGYAEDCDVGRKELD